MQDDPPVLPRRCCTRSWDIARVPPRSNLASPPCSPRRTHLVPAQNGRASSPHGEVEESNLDKHPNGKGRGQNAVAGVYTGCVEAARHVVWPAHNKPVWNCCPQGIIATADAYCRSNAEPIARSNAYYHISSIEQLPHRDTITLRLSRVYLDRAINSRGQHACSTTTATCLKRVSNYQVH